MHFQKPDKPGVWKHPHGTPVWLSLGGCWRLVMLCISSFFGADTEYSMHWHWIGAGPNCCSQSAAWGHRMVWGGEGHQAAGIFNAGGFIVQQTAVPTVTLQHHSSAFCWALLLLETVWSNVWCSGLTVLFSGFIPSIFRDSFSSGLTIVCAFWYLIRVIVKLWLC